MAIKYTKIFRSKAFQNLPKFGIFVCKYIIWQPWCMHSSKLTKTLAGPLRVRRRLRAGRDDQNRAHGIVAAPD
jgi:hypothetical protein